MLVRAALGAAFALALIVGCSPAELTAAQTPAQQRANPAPPPRVEAPPPPGVKTGGSPLVLLPADPGLRRVAHVMDAGRGYTATAEGGGVTVQITGFPAGSADTPITVQQTEYGWDASFSRRGGLYNVTLTCERPADARCADEGFIRKLVGGLTPR